MYVVMTTAAAEMQGRVREEGLGPVHYLLHGASPHSEAPMLTFESFGEKIVNGAKVEPRAS